MKFPKMGCDGTQKTLPDLKQPCMMCMFTAAGLVMALMPLTTRDAALSFFLFGVAGL
jgi:hypothetical protein